MLPPGQLGWRLARKLVDEAAAPGRGRRVGGPGQARVRGGRRHRPGRRPAAARHRHRPLRRPHRQGELLEARTQALLDAWIPLLALCADKPGRPWTAGAIGRGGRDAPVARTAFASVDGADAFLKDLVAIYDAGMREPIPLPLKTGEAWARSAANPRNARFTRREAVVQGPVRPRERGRGARPRLGPRRPAVGAVGAEAAAGRGATPDRPRASAPSRPGCGSPSSSGAADDDSPSTSTASCRPAPRSSRRAPARARPSRWVRW